MTSLYSSVIYGRELSDAQAALLKGVSDHHHNLSWALSFRFGTKSNDYLKLNEIVHDWNSKYLNGDTSSLTAEDKIIIDSVYELRRAIDHLYGNNLDAFVSAFGSSCSLLSKFEALKMIERKLPKFERAIKKAKASKAVSGRANVIRAKEQKQPFIDFCKHLVETGRHHDIKHFDDLLNIDGYDVMVTKVATRTVKKWANEAGINFSGGRKKLK